MPTFTLIQSFMANQYAAIWGQITYFLIILGVLIVASHELILPEVVAAIALVGLFVRSSIFNLIQDSFSTAPIELFVLNQVLYSMRRRISTALESVARNDLHAVSLPGIQSGTA